MSREIDNFLRRKQLIEDAKVQTNLQSSAKNDIVRKLLSTPVDLVTLNKIQADIHAKYEFVFDLSVPKEEITALIKELEGEFDVKKFDALITACRDTVVGNLIKPFGLARILFEDKEGGNVSTVPLCQCK